MNRNYSHAEIKGHGKCAKRLRRLARKDIKKHTVEHREKVRNELGDNLWKYGMIGLSDVGKPRGVKKVIPAILENPFSISAISELGQR